MNKIRVCAFLALVVFIGSVVTDMFSGFMDGWNEAGDQKDFHALPSVSLLVRADDTLPADTLISAAQDTPMYCNTSEVSVQGFRSTKWRWVSFLLFPAGLFALYGFYSVARLVLTATKGKDSIFTAHLALDVMSSIINDLVFYQTLKDGKLYLKDGYPVNSNSPELLTIRAQNSAKRAVNWQKFIDRLDYLNKLRN
jgi:hypothetical protein